MLNYKNHFIIGVIIFFCSYNMFAAEVFKANSKQAIIELKGTNVQPGDILVSGSANDVSMKIKKVNAASSFALAEIIKGRVKKGDPVSQVNNNRAAASDDEIYNEENEDSYDNYGVEEDFIDDDNGSDETDFVDNNKNIKRQTEETDNTSYAYSTTSQRKKFAIGLLGGIDFDILKLKFPNRYEGSGGELPRKNVTASGLSFNANIVLDYDFMDMLGVRIFTGWKRFSAKSQDSHKIYDGPRECYDDGDIIQSGIERDCELRVDLYGLSIQLQYYIPGGTEMIQPLVGLGVGTYFVINTIKNYAIKEMKTMGSIAGIVGVNVIISKNMYLAAQADYNFSLSSSSTAQVHFISAKIGLMYGF